MMLPDLHATQALGRRLADALRAEQLPGCLLLFRGPLGAGKTALIRALLKRLGVTDTVRSPSYTLIEDYPIADRLAHHVDLYRLEAAAELENLGFAELLNGRDICLVEWPERAPQLIAHADLQVAMSIAGAGRRVDWQALTPLGRRLTEWTPV
ncbi:bifunctional tRNA (adenosine(37)-N6)-threonylcarbamoyltransferase complex ATPase subunit type 1 TsaE/phosphotransferase [soil metagenome]